MSDLNPVQPQRQQPTRLPRPWDSLGKNTGVGCHFLLQCMKVKSESEVTQSCPTLSDPMDCSPPGPPSMGFSSVVSNSLWPHGLYPVRLLCPRNLLGKNTGVDCQFSTWGDLPNPGIELVSPALTDRFSFFFLRLSHLGSLLEWIYFLIQEKGHSSKCLAHSGCRYSITIS